jgi:hypothetical protein
MRMNSVRGTSSGERHKRFFWDLGQQWSSLFGHCNWYDFTLIEIGGEWARHSGRFEFEFWVLGVGMRLTYVYDNSFNEEMVGLADRIKAEIEAAHPGAKVMDPFGLLDQIDQREKRDE